MRDLWVALKVRLRLVFDPYCGQDARSIRVRCRQGGVLLSGRVENTYRACRAENLARRMSGVADVANELRPDRATRFERKIRTVFGPAPGAPLTAVSDVIEEPPKNDRAVAECASAALQRRQIPVGEAGLEVCAVDRTVYLLGEAPSEAVAKAAEFVAGAIPEVEGVRNKLRVGARTRGTAE